MKTMFISILSIGLLFSGCEKDECNSQVDDPLMPVGFLPLIQETRSVKTTWTANDQIAIFSDIAIKKNGTTSTASITYKRGATTGVWTPPSADEAWYFSDAIRQHNFYAYHPVGTATSYTAVEIPDISGQDGTKTVDSLKTENDFMRGTGVATKDAVTANLQMFRVFAIINLNVSIKQDAFSNNAATLTDVKFISTNSLPLVNPTSATKATVDLSSGNITCTGGLTTLTLHPASGFSLTPTAISIPVKIFPQRSTIQVQFTIGGKTSVAQALSTSSFVGGRIYNYTIVIDAALEQVGMNDPVIFDWINNNGTPIGPIIPN